MNLLRLSERWRAAWGRHSQGFVAHAADDGRVLADHGPDAAHVSLQSTSADLWGGSICARSWLNATLEYEA
jgi:hypothetical protein